MKLKTGSGIVIALRHWAETDVNPSLSSYRSYGIYIRNTSVTGSKFQVIVCRENSLSSMS